MSNTVSARQGFREEADGNHQKKQIFYTRKCSGQKEEHDVAKRNTVSCRLRVVKQSQAGSHLGRMAFKLRMLIMRSCWPGQVLEEGHSKHEEEQIQRPRGRRDLGCEGPEGLEHGDDWGEGVLAEAD